MSLCPNISSPEWKLLEAAVGRAEAMRDWMENDHQIRNPKEVEAKLERRKTPMVIPLKVKSVIKETLLKSKAVRFKNNILFVLQHKYPEAVNAVAAVNKEYGFGTARILPVQSSKGIGGRTIFKVEINEPITAEPKKVVVETAEPATLFMREYTPIELDLNAVNNTSAREIAHKISAALGVQYEVIDTNQVLAIEPNWKGEVGFFKNETVYFVGDKLRTDTVFHEFSHPFVRALFRDNNKLFNTLYDRLVATPEGAKIIQDVKNLYNFDESDNNFKEEVFVRALTLEAINKLKEVKPSTGFAGFIKDLLYALKQFIRKTFGANIKIETLKTNTSLKDLADILVKGEKIKLDVKPITQEDITAYQRHTLEELEEVKNLKDDLMIKLVNTQSTQTFKWFKKLAEDKRYSAPAEAIGINGSELEQVIELLANYRTSRNEEQFRKKLKLLEEKVGRRDQQAAALINSLLLVQKSAQKIGKHLEELSKDLDNKDNVAQMIYYKHYIDDWITNSDNMIRLLKDQGVPPTNPLYNLVVTNKSLFDNNLKYLSNSFTKNTFSVMQNVLDVLKTSVDEYYNKKREEMVKKGATASAIKQLNDDYEKDKLSDKKYWDIIKGSGTDANRFNSYMEGYMNNQDPAIMGLAGYINRGIHDYLSKIQVKANDVKLKLIPLLEDANWDRSKISSLADKVTFEETIWARNPETGKMEQKNILVYLNEFKGAKNDEIEMILAIEDMEDAAKKRNDPAEAQSWKDIREKREELAKWRADYMHQEKKPEFYARYAIFSNTNLRREAKEEMDDFYEERNIYEKKAFEEGFTDLEDDALWKNYEQRERQLFNEFYPDGRMKEGDELEKVKIRKEYRAASRDMYDYILKPDAFENARKQKIQQLEVDGISESNPLTKDEFDAAMDLWDKRNTQKRLKADPAAEIKKITDRLRELNAKLSPAYKAKVDLTIPYDKIADIEKQHKDPNYQTNGSELSAGEREVLRSNQEKINHLRSVYKASQRLDLTDIEKIEYDNLNKLLASMRTKFASEYYVDAFNSFLENRGGGQVDLSRIKEVTGSSEVTKENADSVIRSEFIINQLMLESPEFEKWFKANHVRVQKYEEVEGIGNMVKTWERLWAWNVTELNDPAAYEQIEIKNDEGKIVKIISGAPSMRYYRRVVKKEFLTGYDSDTGEINLIEGIHVDNRGNWLPLKMEHGAKDDKYQNKEYYRLKDSEDTQDKEVFNLLEGIKEQSLDIQKGLDNSDKLWYEHPRFQMSNLEILQSKGLSKGVTSAWKEFVSIFQKKEDDQEFGYNANITDGMEETISNVKDEEQVTMLSNNLDLKMAPVGGTFKIDLERTSRDIPAALLKYMAHAERNKKFKEMLPTATAFQLVFSDPERAQREMDGVTKKNWLNNSFTNPSDKSARAAAIDFLINREFKGQMLTGPFADNKGFNSIMNMMFGRASMSFFALNIPGALQNQFGPIFQGITESFAGKYWNQANLGRGIGWGFKTMGKVSLELYSPDTKSLDVQIAEVFDMGAGNYEKGVGESMTRTLGKDAASLGWFMSFRRWTETQATLSLGGATLDHIVLKQTMSDGTVREVKYLDAWELDKEGKIKLLDGINPEFANRPITHEVIDGDTIASLAKKYSVTESRIKELNNLKADKLPIGTNLKIANSEEFSKTRAVLHEVSRRNQGAYSTWEQAQLNSNTLGRIVMFMKKFFIPMFMDRWAFKGNIINPRPRYNLATGELTQGYYVTVLHHIVQAIRNLNVRLLYTPSEVDNGLTKRAYVKLITEVGLLIGMTLLYQALFGWDPNDKDRYEKLRKKSGALPTPFTVDDPQHPFHLNGFLANHALSLMMRIRSENEQLLPIPGLGLDNYSNMLSLKSYVMGPTVDAFVNVATDATKMMTGDDSAYYKKGVGTYDWNQTGAPKILQHLAIAMGLTNKDVQPVLKIKSIEDFQREGGKR